MKIVIGNDHAGVDLKNKIKEELRKKGHEVINVGTDTLDSVDYPDIAKEVSKKVLDEEVNFGILICVKASNSAHLRLTLIRNSVLYPVRRSNVCILVNSK